MSDAKYTDDDLQRFVGRMDERFESQTALLLESVDALLDKRLKPIEADIQELKTDMKTVKAIVTETNRDLKDARENIKDLQHDMKSVKKRTEKLTEYTDDFENHEVRIAKLKQAHA